MSINDLGCAGFNLRSPSTQDGFTVHKLIAECPPLDPNSAYCNLLQCTHFANTCVVAEDYEKNLVGFISGYRLPEHQATFFVWQIAVAASARGMGLAGHMLNYLIEHPNAGSVRFIETTIAKANGSSRGVFRKLADKLNCELTEQEFFDRNKHFDGNHDSEWLIRLGPFNLDMSGDVNTLTRSDNSIQNLL